jgi:hypothetical protein
MVKILRSRRHRWRGVPLGGPLQRGCKFCFAAHDGKAKTHEIAAWLRPEIVLAGGKLLHRHLTEHTPSAGDSAPSYGRALQSCGKARE